jgi:predicted permease
MDWVRDFITDATHAGRSLLRSPAFSATSILTIALGIGANTAVFSVIHAVLLDPLPFRDPERLVHIAETHPDFPSLQVAAPDLFDWQRTATSFEAMAGYTFQAMNKWTILGDGEPESVQVLQASHSLFEMLGIRPLLGRTYTAEEEASKAPVVVLNETLWRRKYGSDPSIIGRKIRLVDWPVTVIGIVGARQAQPSWGEVWMPLSFLDTALTESRRFRPLEVIARLKPGVTLEQAQAQMTGIAGNLARSFPETNGRTGASVLPLTSWMTGPVRPSLLMAWTAVSLVLLVACANVAHLILVRTVHRSREIAVRAALGAGSARLTSFLFAESLTLAAVGGIIGVLAARLSLPVLLRLAANEIPRLEVDSLSPTALAFGAGAAVLCACLFALPAIFHSRKLDVYQIIKQGSGLTFGRRRYWFGASIITAEIALAFVVLTGAGLLYRSFSALLEEDTGFDSRGVLAVDVPLALDWRESAKVFDQKVAPALRAIPGVTSVGAVNCAPMTLRPSEASRFSSRFGIVGRTFEPGQFPMAQVRWITPDYFRTLQIPLKRGRAFTEADMGKPGYIINEALARRFFPNQDPVGQHILMDVTGPKPDAVPIIGVAADIRDLGLDTEPVPTLYSASVSNRMTVLIRTGVRASSLIPAVRAAIRKSSPDAPITLLAPLEEVVEASLALRRFALELLGIFAALATVLTAVGVYGVISYTVSHRTDEFAIRFALGAERRHVRNLILGGFALPTLGGLLAGGALAYAFGWALRTQLYKLSPTDPSAFAVSGIALLLLVLASALRPAMRLKSISPAAILRE